MAKPVRSEISPSALFLPLSLTVHACAWRLAGMAIKFAPSWQPFERVTADCLDAPLDGRRGL